MVIPIFAKNSFVNTALTLIFSITPFALRWRHNERDSVSNRQPHDRYSSVLSGVDQRKHQSSASLAFVRGIHRWPVNSPHKCPVTWKIFSFDDVIMAKRPADTWWRHDMETRSALLVLFEKTSSPVCSPHKGAVMDRIGVYFVASMEYFLTNSGVAEDFRRR